MKIAPLKIPQRLASWSIAFCLLSLSYGAIYAIVPSVRAWHNQHMLALKHTAVQAEANVTHTGAERTRIKFGYSITPIFGMHYQVNGINYIGFVKGMSGSATDYIQVSEQANNKNLPIWIDAQHPERFYANPANLGWQNIVSGAFWYLIVLALTLAAWSGWWVWQRKQAGQQYVLLAIPNTFNISMLFSALGFAMGVGLFVVAELLPPWLPRNYIFQAQALQKNELLMGAQWQSWQFIDFRVQDYIGGGTECKNIGYVDSITIALEIRWRQEDSARAHQQMAAIGDTTYCAALLQPDQSIALNQTDNEFAGIIEEQNAAVAAAAKAVAEAASAAAGSTAAGSTRNNATTVGTLKDDGYIYSDATVSFAYKRKQVATKTTIKMPLDAKYTARFPLYLYVW